MKISIQILLSLALASLFGHQASIAQDSSGITGIWKTFDDETNRPAALIEITVRDGIYSGMIKKLLDPSAQIICEKCTDDRKGKPVLGMQILTGLKQTGESYSNGRILDPDDGEIYRTEMKLKDQGSKLDVRAFIGIPLLGRTQTWVRER
jgi:uncharacterized protein (DUF2147 family)